MIQTAQTLPPTPKPPRSALAILRQAQEMIHQHTKGRHRPSAVVVSHQEHGILRKYQTAIAGLPADPSLPLRLDGIQVLASAQLQPGQVGVIEMPPKPVRKRRESGLIV